MLVRFLVHTCNNLKPAPFGAGFLFDENALPELPGGGRKTGRAPRIFVLLHSLASVHHTEAIPAVGPDENKRVLPFRDILQRILHFAR